MIFYDFSIKWLQRVGNVDIIENFNKQKNIMQISALWVEGVARSLQSNILHDMLCLTVISIHSLKLVQNWKL